MSENLLAKYPFPVAARRDHGLGDGRSGTASPAAGSSSLSRAGEVLLSPGQKQALLLMRKSETANAVLDELRKRKRLDTKGADYYALAHAGYAINKGSFHVLTPAGRWRADNLAIAYARELKMHLLTFDYGRPGRAASVRCTCGWIAWRSRAIPSYVIGMGRDAAHHLEDVGANK